MEEALQQKRLDRQVVDVEVPEAVLPPPDTTPRPLGVHEERWKTFSKALERHHRVVENHKFLTGISFPNTNAGIGDEIVLNIMLCYVKSLYYYHFIGADGYREDYESALRMLKNLEKKAVSLSSQWSWKDATEFGDEVRRVLAYARDNRLE